MNAIVTSKNNFFMNQSYIFKNMKFFIEFRNFKPIKVLFPAALGINIVVVWHFTLQQVSWTGLKNLRNYFNK